jgi:hypothetical protein
MTREELIEKLEQATGGDRELDLHIWWRCKASNSGQEMGSDYFTMNLKMNDAPRYTSSLDAAVSLVPEGFQWAIKSTPTEDGPYCVAQIDWKESEGNTPAIALTIACLKARSGI